MHIFSIHSSSRTEKRCQMLQTLFLLFQRFKNPRWYASIGTWLHYFELYSISSVQCGSNLNKVLRNAATPAAVNYVFKTYMKLRFNPQMPTISQDIFHSFEKLKAFSKSCQIVAKSELQCDFKTVMATF